MKVLKYGNADFKNKGENNLIFPPFYTICNLKEEEFKVQKKELSYVKWYKIEDIINMIENNNKEVVFKKEEIDIFEKLKNIK